jgi:hypothetical protein
MHIWIFLAILNLFIDPLHAIYPQAGCRKKEDGSCTSPYSVVNWASLTANTVDDDATVSSI